MPPRKTRDFQNDMNRHANAQRSEELAKRYTGSDYKVSMIPLNEIHFNPNNTVFNANDTPEDVQSLADGLKVPSDLRTPITLNRDPDGTLQLIAGEKRTKAFLRKRKEALEANPTLKSTEWDFIPAFIHDNLSEIQQRIMLYLDNLETRELSAEQRYRAFEMLISYCEKENNGQLTTSDKDKLASALRISRKTIERLQKIRKNASEEDIRLFNEGKITFEEFKSRTNALIKAQNRALAKRNEILSKRAIPKSYFDEDTNSVYYIGQTSDPRTNEAKFCTFAINQFMDSAIHLPELGEYSAKSLAQVDLDRYASNNLLPEYHGDFSEYRVGARVTASGEDNSEDPDDIESLFENSEAKEFESKKTENAVADSDGETDAEQPEHTQHQSDFVVNGKDDEESDIETEGSFTRTEEKTDSPKKKEPNTAENKNNKPVGFEANHNISHYEGLNLNGMSVQGSLFAAPSGRVYIISNFDFGKNIGTGKFQVSCTAEEVVKESVRRIDDV